MRPYRTRAVGLAGLVASVALLVPVTTTPAIAQTPGPGSVQAYGDAASEGGPGALNAPVVAMTATADGHGYWLAAADGGVFAFGDAVFHGAPVGSPGYLGFIPVVGLAATPDGDGYWLVQRFGEISRFGDAGAFGSLPQDIVLNAPIVGMAATPDGKGYWLVASDGGVFAFGDAAFYGSEGGATLHDPVVGMAATRDGRGYWLVASDGGVFAFGDAAFHGSEGATPLNVPIVGMAPTRDGGGYWLAAGDGGVFALGDAAFDGSAGGAPPAHPVAAIAASTAAAGSGYWLATSASGPTPVPSPPQIDACGTPQIRPTLILLACADGNARLQDLTWSSWSTSAATATGSYSYNLCTPDCADGSFVTFPATATFDQAVSTSAGVEFSRATWTYREPSGAAVTFSERLYLDA